MQSPPLGVKFYLKFLKKIPRRLWIKLFLSIFLAISIFFIIFIGSYYIHEFGHASVAVVSSMVYHSDNLVLNFNYNKLFGILVPQQTEWIEFNLPVFIKILYSLSGTIFNLVFYFLFFLILVYLFKINPKKEGYAYLLFTFFLLSIDNILNNLICGTDGLKITCNYLIDWISFLLNFIVILFLAISFLCILFFEDNQRVINPPPTQKNINNKNV